jgi:hypothetical protein
VSQPASWPSRTQIGGSLVPRDEGVLAPRAMLSRDVAGLRLSTAATGARNSEGNRIVAGGGEDAGWLLGAADRTNPETSGRRCRWPGRRTNKVQRQRRGSVTGFQAKPTALLNAHGATNISAAKKNHGRTRALEDSGYFGQCKRHNAVTCFST